MRKTKHVRKILEEQGYLQAEEMSGFRAIGFWRAEEREDIYKIG